MEKFTLPEDLTQLSADELTALRDAAHAAYDELSAIERAELTDENVSDMAAAVEGAKAVKAEVERREERERNISASQEEMEALRAQNTEAAADESVEAADETTETEVESAEDFSNDETQEEGGEVPAERRGSSVEAVAANTNTHQVRSRGRASLTAAADVPGHPLSADLGDLEGLTQAFNARMQGFPRKPSGSPTNRVFNRYGVATISRGIESFDGLTDTNPDYRDGESLLQAAANERRLAGNSLTAAGGWCAPSETIYDLCEQETLDGLLDVPEVQLTRGGIINTVGPDFSDIFNNVGFCQTEAEAEAGTEKDCYDVPCPDFTETRLDACGICIRAGILTNAGYPELVQRYLRGAIVAHQHKMSIRTINEIADLIAATPTDMTGGLTPGGVTSGTLYALELLISGQRESFRLSMNATMEVIAPFWLKTAIRADLANRTGVDFMNVTDAMIDGWFALRGARVQWVYGYQPLGEQCPTGLPSTVEVLVYPAGAFVRGVKDVISLDAVYDSAGLQENTYTALFMEEGIGTYRTCHGGCRVTLPVCVSGQTGAADLSNCLLQETS